VRHCLARFIFINVFLYGISFKKIRSRLFIHSFLHKTVGTFCFFKYSNNTIVSILIPVSLCSCVRFLPFYIPESEFAGYMCIFNCIKYYQVVLQNDCSSLHPSPWSFKNVLLRYNLHGINTYLLYIGYNAVGFSIFTGFYNFYLNLIKTI
jgi:hypothetical protein